MTAMVALLRGINVGGRNKLAMADLRRIVEGLGHRQVTTYVQSGNVVFVPESPDATPAEVAAGIAAAIHEATGLDPAVTVRTAAELAAVVAGSPYADRVDDPTHLHVVFSVGDGPGPLDWYDPAVYAPEELAVVGREVHLHVPDGLGRSKLAADLTRRATRAGALGTARNWRSVLALTGMAAAAS